MSEWISVKERLPTWGQLCIVLYKTEVDVAFYKPVPENDLHFEYHYPWETVPYGGYTDKVAYWMPLPEPLKEKEK